MARTDPLLAEQWHMIHGSRSGARDAGNLDWNVDTDEMTPRDLGLLAKVQFGVVDMGAYEFSVEAPPGGGEN